MLTSRRQIVRLITGAGLFPAAVPRLLSQTFHFAVDRLARESMARESMARRETPPRQPGERRYRVNATIMLFSIPLLSRPDVGSGYTVVERENDTVAIQFGAGSFPERARGLNRLGYIQEVVVEKAGKPVECAYFAFMTTSTEKNLEQARKALESSGGMIAYAAAEGAGGEGRFVSRLDRLMMPSGLAWRDCPALLQKIRDAMAASVAAKRTEKRLAANIAAPATFLYAVRAAMLEPLQRTDRVLVYNGKDYQLQTERQADAAAGSRFAERKLVGYGKRVMRIDATLREIPGGAKTPFKVWFEAGQEQLPPLRFEYQARSFLRLVFEADPASAVPAVGLVLGKSAVSKTAN